MTPEVSEVLIFEVSGQRLGLPSDAVRELHAAMAVAPLVGAARHVEGVVNLRGHIIPVIDMRRVLGMPVKDVALTDHLVVVNAGDRMFALRVDRALELRQIPTAALYPMPDSATLAARFDDGLVLIHPLSELLRGVREAS